MQTRLLNRALLNRRVQKQAKKAHQNKHRENMNMNEGELALKRRKTQTKYTNEGTITRHRCTNQEKVKLIRAQGQETIRK